MDIQNNVFAVVSTIVDTVLDFENTDKNALAIHKRINNIEFNIKRYDEKRKTYMKCLELLEMAHISTESPAYRELVSAYGARSEDVRHACHDSDKARGSLNNLRKETVKKIVLAMGITDEYIFNMLVELAIKQIAQK
jgi:hypothetical protein